MNAKLAVLIRLSLLAGTTSFPTSAVGTSSKPFATLECARDAIRNLKASRGLLRPVTVHVRGGTYALPRTLELGAEDSGTQNAPIVYRAHGDEKVRLLEGRPIPFMTHP